MSRPFPKQDMHVHSTFSDGRATIPENITRAEELELDALTLVDHVRVDTPWVGDFVATVAAARASTSVRLLAGVEAKILTVAGDLDLPPDLCGADRVYIADHQLPGQTGPEHPKAVREAIAAGERCANDVVAALVEGTVNAMERHPGNVLAHLFSLLPKIGLDESHVTDGELSRIARVASETGSTIELSERWRCPGPRAAQTFAAAGVRIAVSTDSHSRDTLGVYDWCRTIWNECEPAFRERRP